MRIYGWTGKILRVDLTSKEVAEEDYLGDTYNFIGGRDLATNTDPVDYSLKLIL